MGHKYTIRKVTEKTPFIMATTSRGLLIGFDFTAKSLHAKNLNFQCWEFDLAELEELLDKLVDGHQALEDQLKQGGSH
jgi:hypothetical protein